MKKVVVGIILMFILGCDIQSEVTAYNAVEDEHKVWIFAQFNTPYEGDDGDTKLDSYYYYGKVSESLFNLVKNNELHKGYILLEEVRYWGTDDKVYEYRDEEYSGEILFRIEDLVKVNLVHTPPQITGTDEVEESQEEVVKQNTAI